MNENGKLKYQQFSGDYLPLNSERIVKSESLIDYNFPDFPTGKYILGISGVRTVYYPGTINREKATIFQVKTGEITDVTFRIP